MEAQTKKQAFVASTKRNTLPIGIGAGAGGLVMLLAQSFGIELDEATASFIASGIGTLFGLAVKRFTS